MEWLKGTSARHEFEHFVSECSDGLLRTVYLLTWDLGEAENLVQETFLRAAKRWPTIRVMEHPLAYVRRIAVNLAIDGGQERSRSRAELGLFDQRSPVLGPDESAAAELLRIDTRLEITWVLAELPRRQRAVIVLRYFEDLSEAEIATYLGWPLGTVKSTASRALERLQRVMDDANPTPTSPVANE